MSGALVLGIETSCDETGIGIVRGTTLLANAIASSMDEHARYGGVVPEVAARAHLEALTPDPGCRARRGGRRRCRDRRDRGHERPRARRSPHGRRRRRQGARRRPRQAALRREPPRRPRRRRPARRRAARAAHDRPARLRRAHVACCWCATSPTTSSCSARPSTTPRARRSTRWPGCSGCPTPAAPRSTGRRRPATRPRSASRAGSPRRRTSSGTATTSRSRGSRPRSPAGSRRRATAATRCRSPDVAAGFREAVVDVLTAKALAACADLGIPRLLLGGGVVANARLRAVAHRTRRRRGCRPPHPAARAVHRQRRHDRRARRPPDRRGARAVADSDFGADSTLPVTTVQA